MYFIIFHENKSHKILHFILERTELTDDMLLKGGGCHKISKLTNSFKMIISLMSENKNKTDSNSYFHMKHPL